MKIKPLQDWVVIRSDEMEERTAGGLFIPEVAKEKPHWGFVESAGPGRYEEEKEQKGSKKERRFVPTEVKAGDKVLFEKYMAKEFSIDGEKVILVRESSILGTLAPEGEGTLQARGTTSLQKKGKSELQPKGAGAVQTVKKKASEAKKPKK